MVDEMVEFPAGDNVCAGRFVAVPAAEPRPCVVLCTGFGGTQDTPSIRAAAEAFAERGLAALTFDYRNFGRSGGRPRQLVDLHGQLEDIHAAVRYARGRADVSGDRIVLWGTSLGGGHVITAAAADRQIAAVVAQVPFNGFPRRVEDRSTTTTLRLLAAMVRDRVHGWLGREPFYIPAVGPSDTLAVMASEEARDVIAAMDSPTWQNRVAPRALLDMMRYRPADHVSALAMPLLVCAGTRDRETPVTSAAQLAERAARGELREYPYRHFDFYLPEFRRQVLEDQVEFLERVLGRP
ncbi:alpha/beta hydrolase [Mycobacterium sp. SMC-4]|uniref:alpha/beta hydrolase n=1 Tax=Mycobacterium sp. SMC-4 TaxID=2857059 RepID=UPI003CFF786F